MCFDSDRARASSPYFLFQSPLHRGMCFDRNLNEIGLYTANMFQSPLHRGMCFDNTVDLVDHPGLNRFSPLFIGACVSTTKMRPMLWVCSGFQSPLHRGMCFDPNRV